MSYVIGGSNGEASAFEKTIANFAIEVLHENLGIVQDTNIVTPQQGVTFRVPQLAPVSFGDYDDSTGDGMTLLSQNPVMDSASITATPCLAQTTFSSFYDEVTSFDFAAGLGSDMAKAYAEKVDQRVLKAFQGFKATTGDTNYTVGNTVGSVTVNYGDGFDRVKEIGAVELAAAGATLTGHEATSANTVVGLINLVIKKWRLSRNSGAPLIVLSPVEESRLLAELTNVASVGASGAMGVGALSAAGNELQTTGMIRNFNGATIKFTTFLSSDSRATLGGSAAAVKVGGAFGPQALYTVMVAGLTMKLREMPNPAFYSLTGTGLLGSGVGSKARGLAINIA
jgi:hypothetical protein